MTSPPNSGRSRRRSSTFWATRVHTVTPWLADHILATDKSGARVVWLTRRKAFARFMTAAFRKRDLFVDVKGA